MTPRVQVDPGHYQAASRIMGHDFAGALSYLGHTLIDQLQTTERMAGHDAGGMKFAQQYDKVAGQTISSMMQLTTAALKLANLLEATGLNHGRAEAASDPTRSVPIPADTTDYTLGRGFGGSGGLLGGPVVDNSGLPSAAGGSGDTPVGWDLIHGSVGWEWPDGHQDRLRHAAGCWRSAASGFEEVTSYVDQAIDVIRLQQAPEVDDAARVCAGMATQVRSLARSFRQLASSCDDLAGRIDHVHDQAEGVLLGLVATSAITQGAGWGGAIFSFGTSVAAAESAEAGEVAVAAGIVGGYIATFVTEAGEFALAVASVDSEVLAVERVLQPILTAEVTIAEPVLVTGLPTAAVTDATTLAEARLAHAASPIWRQAPSPRGFAAEDVIKKELLSPGTGLPKSFPTVDGFDAATGEATSIKSIDLLGKTYQDPRALTSTLKGYVLSVGRFKGAAYDGAVVSEDDIVTRTLRVVIQPGTANSSQVAALDQMTKYAQENGVRMLVTEVP